MRLRAAAQAQPAAASDRRLSFGTVAGGGVCGGGLSGPLPTAYVCGAVAQAAAPTFNQREM